MNVFQKREKVIMHSFSKDNSWEEKYRRIIEWGRRSDEMTHFLKKNEWLVEGCQSKVWLFASIQQGRMILKADSDALITKGLIALMVYFYSDSLPKDVFRQPPTFIEKLDLANHLTPSRRGGLVAFTSQIQNYAKAFLLMQKK